MGAGCGYRVGPTREDRQYAYWLDIECPILDGKPNQDQFDLDLHDAITSVLNALPPSFGPVQTSRETHNYPGRLNGQYAAYVDGDLVLRLEVRERFDWSGNPSPTMRLAEANFWRSYRAWARRALKSVELRVATSAWTSAKVETI